MPRVYKFNPKYREVHSQSESPDGERLPFGLDAEDLPPADPLSYCLYEGHVEWLARRAGTCAAILVVGLALIGMSNLYLFWRVQPVIYDAGAIGVGLAGGCCFETAMLHRSRCRKLALCEYCRHMKAGEVSALHWGRVAVGLALGLTAPMIGEMISGFGEMSDMDPLVSVPIYVIAAYFAASGCVYCSFVRSPDCLEVCIDCYEDFCDQPEEEVVVENLRLQRRKKLCRLIPIVIGLPLSVLMYMIGLDSETHYVYGSTISAEGLTACSWVPLAIGALAIVAPALRVYMLGLDTEGEERDCRKS